MPRITVLLPVYNAMPYLRYAVESLQKQTLPDFKVLVFNDGSTDGSGVYLDALGDPRFTIIHQQNAGLAVTLNRMIPMVDTEYVARMDADDICLPERLKKQLTFMDAHPEVAVVGTRGGYIMGKKMMASFGMGTRKITLSYAPPIANPPYWDPLSDRGILIHSTVMMRTVALKNVGGYPDMVPGQDMALWHQMTQEGHKLANMDEMLLLSRVAKSGISSSNLAKQHHSWYYTEYRTKCLAENRVPMSIEDYIKTHPLTGNQLELLRSKAMLRNALADLLALKVFWGLVTFAWVVMRDSSLVLYKIRNRT